MTEVRIRYLHKKTFRAFLHQLSRLAFWLLADVEIIGEENIPEDEPIIVVGNHFCFVDPVCFANFKCRSLLFDNSTCL